MNVGFVARRRLTISQFRQAINHFCGGEGPVLAAERISCAAPAACRSTGRLTFVIWLLLMTMPSTSAVALLLIERSHHGALRSPSSSGNNRP
jgi:hypothetical protein